MTTYSIDVYEKDGRWQAVIHHLLLAGEGSSPEEATAEVIQLAAAAENRLLETGLARRSRQGRVVLKRSLGQMLAPIAAEYGLRTLFVFVLLASLYLVVRADLSHQIQAFRTDITSELSQIRSLLGDSSSTSSDAAERVRQRAQHLNQRLLPAAEELRPLFRTLLSDPAPTQTPPNQ